MNDTNTNTLSPADVDAIARQIGDGAAALDSWARQAAGGTMRPDDAREYWTHLPDNGQPGSWRVARVTVYRSPDGSRWTIGDVDVFRAAPRQPSAVRHDDAAAAAIVAAAAEDDRQIVRQGAAYAAVA